MTSSGEERPAVIATKLHKALRDPTRAWVLAQINERDGRSSRPEPTRPSGLPRAR